MEQSKLSSNNIPLADSYTIEVEKLLSEEKLDEAKAVLEKLVISSAEEGTQLPLLDVTRAYLETENEAMNEYSAILESATQELQGIQSAETFLQDTQDLNKARKTLSDS